MFSELKIICHTSGESKIINIYKSGLSVHDLNLITTFYEWHKDFSIEVVE